MTISLRNVLALVLIFCFASTASAITITSAPFEIGYGFSIVSGAVGGWSTDETSGANTPMVQGDFSLTPVVTGGQFDSAGPGFPSRTLTSGGGFTGVSVAYSTEAGFQAVVNGAYVGALPAGTNHRLQMNITQVSIYGVAHPNFVAGNENLTILETTPGNIGASGTATLVPTGAYATASSYTQIVWDPADFETLGLVSSRTFTLASDDLRGIDGFEVYATLDLIYDPIPPAPEPSTFLLLAASVLGLHSVGRRRRANRVCNE